MLPKDVVVNVIIPKVVEEKNREIGELKKQNAALKRIMYHGVMRHNAFDNMQCKTCDKHFVIFGYNYVKYNNPINILDESTELVYLFCDDCGVFYCMDCVFKTPIETRLSHLYCPVCKHGNECTTHLSQYTY